jgi:hypothetical protein
MDKPSTPDRLLHIMLRAQHLSREESRDNGYAMVIVSIVTLMMFSLLAAYLAITNLTKSSTNAYMEGNSTFYAAESGLNQRASEIRQRFIGYGTPNGISPGQLPGTVAGIANMLACLDPDTSNDGSDDFACQKLDLNYKHALGVKVTEQGSTNISGNIKYSAFTFTSDRTIYTDPVRRIPQFQVIPAGQLFAGLNAQTYRYTIFSLATSKQSEDLDARASTVLEMTFQSRVIPLFQFAAFYDGDLEMNSTAQMNINGRVHTNANFYAQPTPDAGQDTRLLSFVTVAGLIYNRVDAMTIPRNGNTRVLISGDPANPTNPANIYANFPVYDASRVTPLSPAEIAPFQGRVLDGGAGVSSLRVPQPGFLRKRDRDNNIGEYYGKADLRLEMVPRRGAGNVPFNFTAIKNGGTGGSCVGFDISTNRQGDSLNCTQLNEGQLRSLQQPVMVKIVSNDERTRFCSTASATVNSQRLRALQVAITAQNTPIPFSQLSLALNDPANVPIRDIVTTLTAGLNPAQSPTQIALAAGGCFLPAPIQVLDGGTVPSAVNYTWNSSFYDRRENRWIGMLQTNIGSLTVWNRDGLYVDRDNTIASNDIPNVTQINAAFNGGTPTPTYDTNALLFLQAPARATAPPLSFQRLGLGSADTTEGGLVLHATVSDDTDGDGTNDLTIDPVDNLRNYPGGKRNSPYGFAISDGADLPGALTVATDRGIYIQGDYNNFGGDVARQPASIVGDTITVLSNNCLNPNAKINCGILAGQNLGAATTINAGFLSLTDRSNGNISRNDGSGLRYSGGLNNYMRMIENWNFANFNYTGSFISLGSPQEFSGAYVAGSTDPASYYTVPSRNFTYDLNFNAADLLPPLTPRVIYLQQDAFRKSSN